MKIDRSVFLLFMVVFAAISVGLCGPTKPRYQDRKFQEAKDTKRTKEIEDSKALAERQANQTYNDKIHQLTRKYNWGYRSKYSSEEEFLAASVDCYRECISDLASPDPDVRTAAGRWGGISRGNWNYLLLVSMIPDLASLLDSEHDEVVRSSVQLIDKIADDALEQKAEIPELNVSVDKLAEVLSDESRSEETRRWTAIAMSSVGRALGDDAIAKFVVPLAKATHSESEDICRFSLDALGHFRSGAVSALPDVFIELRKSGMRGASAAEAIPLMMDESNKNECLSELLAGLKKATSSPTIADRNQKLFVYYVVQALAWFGPDAKDAVPLLTPLLNSRAFQFDRIDIPRETALTLEFIGDSASPAIDELAKLAKRPAGQDDRMRWESENAFWALCACGEEGVKKAIEIGASMDSSRIWIDVSHFHAGCGRLEVLSQLKDLKKLSITGNVGEYDPEGQYFYMHRRTVPVENYSLQPDYGLLRKLAHVESLTLDFTVSNMVLSHLSDFKKLKSLVIERDHGSFVSHLLLNLNDESLMHIGKLESLESLEFETAFSFDSASLQNLSQLSRLQNLRLSFNWKQEGFDPSGVAHLASLRNLTKLHLSVPSLTDKEFEALNKLTLLEQLSLYSRDVDPKCYEQLTDLKNLEEFCPHKRINDHGIKCIADHMPRLKKLDLSYSKSITDASVKDLARMKNLEYLAIWNTALVRSDELQSLKSTLPNCEIAEYD